MKPGYTADIGLEVHAELQTQSKMFCACPVADLTQASPNTLVCPVCAGMPGTLPVINAKAIDYALRVALALECTIAPTSRFARKNYFYPDLPKGYQISQYDFPLAEHGLLPVYVDDGWVTIRIRRVHLEEDTAKLTHIHPPKGKSYSLVDLNRAGVPLLEIVSEPDMHSIEQVRAYTRSLRTLLQYLEVNSGDLEKGVIRFEANVSVRRSGSDTLGTRVEIKNLNSFRAMTDAIAYELNRQTAILDVGGEVAQETLGWNEVNGETRSQRSKEEAHDYRYFPEPDLPPLTIPDKKITNTRIQLPERPDQRFRRFVVEFNLDDYQAELLTRDRAVAEFFEASLTLMEQPDPLLAANWILGELFAIINASNLSVKDIPTSPGNFAILLGFVQKRKINQATAKSVLAQMCTTGDAPQEIIRTQAFELVSDMDTLAQIIDSVLAEHPQEVTDYHNGKIVLRGWFFGQVMQKSGGQADPAMVKEILARKLRPQN